MLSFFQELLFAPGTSVVKTPLLPIIAMVPLFASAFSRYSMEVRQVICTVDQRLSMFFDLKCTLKTHRSVKATKLLSSIGSKSVVALLLKALQYRVCGEAGCSKTSTASLALTPHFQTTWCEG